MSVRKIFNASAGYTASTATSTVTGPSDTSFDSTSLLLTGDVEVDPSFANVSLLLTGNDLLDKSNNKLTVAANGNAVVSNTTKKFGTGSYYFDGTGDYLTVPSSSNFTFGTGDFTIELWASFNSVSQQQLIIDFRPVGSNGVYPALYISNSILYYYTSSTNAITSSTVFANVWYHISVARNGSNTKLFINGVQVGSTYVDSTNYSNGAIIVGASGFYANGTDSPFNGYIDDLRITKGVARYTTNFTPPVKALPTHEILDSSVYRLPVTAYGNARIDTTTTKKFGTGSMYFDGSSYISVPASTNWVTGATSSLTIECWFYPTVVQYSYIMDQPTGNASAIAINFGSTGADYINVYNNGWTAQIGNITLPVNQWTHFAFVLNSGVPTVYVNGILQTGTYTSNRGWGVNQPIHIGQWSGGGLNFTGYIDDFRITKGSARYTANFTPPTASLPTIPPTIPADPWWGNVSLLLDGNTTDAYDPYWQNVSLMLTGDDFIDWSNNHLAITNTNITRSSTIKKYGTSSLAFNGVSGNALSITSPGTTNSIGTGDFTAEAWAYYLDITGWRDIICFVGPTSSSWGITTNNGDLGAYGIGINSSGTIVPINQWFHVAVTRQSGTVRLFLNGGLVTSATNTTSFTNTQINIGSWSTTNSENLNGYIAELRVTKGVARYTSNFTPPTAALPSYKIQDRTQNNLTVTPYGNVQLSTDVMKNGTGSMFFDGTGDYLTIPMSSNLQLGSGQFTVECWFYANSISGTNTALMGCYRVTSYPSNTAGWDIIYQSGTITFRWGSPAYNDVGQIATSANQWHHVAVVNVGSNIKMYIDGSQVASVTTNATVTDSAESTLWIGWAGSISGTTINPFNGYIDDLRITKGYARYTQNFTPPSQSFATQYISTGYDANYADVSLLLNGNGTNGSTTFTDLSSTPKTITAYGNAQISTAVKKYGTGAMAFDGSGDYLSTPATSNLSFGTGDFTIECWVYANNLGSFNSIFAQWPDNGGTSNNSYVLESVGSSMDFYCVASGSVISATLGTITTGSWIHYAICRSGNALYPFKNGVLGTTVSITQTLNSPTSAVTVGGNVAGGGFWNGYIDDLRITKGIARYTTNFTPPTYQLPTDTTGTVIDPLRSSTSLLLRGNGTNGSTSFTDESPNGLTVTNNGSVTVNTTTKKYGTGSMAFSGSNYLTIASSTYLALPNEFTIECWVYCTAAPTYSVFLGITGGIQIGLDVNSYLAVALQGVTFQLNSITTVPLNIWNHIAVTRNTANVVNIYLNGISVASGTIATSYSAGDAYINYNLASTGSKFTGYLDDLRITKGVARYTANFTPPTYEDPIVTGTVYDYNYPQVSLLLNGDGTNGSTVFKDLSSSPKAITAYGNAQISTAVKKYGTGAMYFDGTGDYLSIAHSTGQEFGSGDFTIEFWCYQSAFSTTSHWVSQWNSTTGYNFAVYNVSGELRFAYTTNGSTVTALSSTYTLTTNSWAHVAVVRNNASLLFFVDGNLKATTSISGTLYSGTGALEVGRNGDNTQYYTGYIDDLRITKGLARYTQNFTPPTAPLPTSYA